MRISPRLIKLRLLQIPVETPEGFVLCMGNEVWPEGEVTKFCADRLRRKARLQEFNTPDDPPIVTADLISRRGRVKRNVGIKTSIT